MASLLARIDGLMAQIAARDERIDELLVQVKALNAAAHAVDLWKELAARRQALSLMFIGARA